MKLKVLAAGAALSLALVGCQSGGDGNDAQEGARGTDNNIEQTRYENNTGDGMTGDRNPNMIRDSERNQDRNGDRDNNRDNDRDNNGDNNQDNNRGNNGDNNTRYDVAEEAADKITDQVDEIDGAYVITTDNNAYVAANLDNDNGNRDNNDRNNDQGGELTDEVKEEISDIVKSVDNDIDNVFVSTNPDFFDLTNNYADDLNNGEPVEGFFDQMGNMIERLFPQNR